jgi:hypothetical protein
MHRWDAASGGLKREAQARPNSFRPRVAQMIADTTRPAPAGAADAWPVMTFIFLLLIFLSPVLASDLSFLAFKDEGRGDGRHRSSLIFIVVIIN